MARRLPAKRLVIDGEDVVEGANGIVDFALLHSRKHDARCYLIGSQPAAALIESLRPLRPLMRKHLPAALLDRSARGSPKVSPTLRASRSWSARPRSYYMVYRNVKNRRLKTISRSEIR